MEEEKTKDFTFVSWDYSWCNNSIGANIAIIINSWKCIFWIFSIFLVMAVISWAQYYSQLFSVWHMKILIAIDFAGISTFSKVPSCQLHVSQKNKHFRWNFSSLAWCLISSSGEFRYRRQYKLNARQFQVYSLHINKENLQ